MPVRITVSGRELIVPWRPAGEWLAALGRLSSVAGILLDPEPREVLADLVMETATAPQDLLRESHRILEEATGRRWWEASKLMSASVSGETLGRLVLSGVDPWHRSIGEWVEAVYSLYVKGADAKQRLKVDFELSIPPPGYEDEWGDDAGDDPEAIAAAMAKMMGG